MKLTWKLCLAVGLGVLAVLAAHAALRVHRDIGRFRQSVRDNHRTIGLVLSAAIEEVAARDGEDRARSLVAEVDRRQSEMEIHWVAEIDGDPVGETMAEPGLFASVSGVREGQQQQRSYTTLRLPGASTTAIEIVEPLAREAEHVHEAVVRTASTTFVVLFLCVAIILTFGVWFVGRPLDALRRHARRVGRGEVGIATPIHSRDEIGELALEMNTMSAALDEARVRVRREEAARLDALAQLRQADRLRVVGELAASVAHDLGTPMGTVNARAQMIASGEVDSSRARELAAKIVDEIAVMSVSIRQLLEHGRRNEPQRSWIEVGPWASAILDVVRPLAERRDLKLTLELATEHPRIELDPLHMRHVLVNLLSNAIDASPRGASVEVVIDDDGPNLRIAVRDHGPGIAAEHLAAVFEPFFTTKSSSEGSGLGLSVARGIIEEHGGHLSTRAGIPDGTCFEVTLPRVPARGA
ncbi:MAG: HAMP domain-containing histidine kinase [Deltaproteobacteria bacterium]|nr:HAMP domain-containing histidine kinase [Deltaproteobacteria bacterium]